MSTDTALTETELTITSKNQLNECYLNFLTKGGLVIPTPSAAHQLGDTVCVKVNLFNDDSITFTGKLVWQPPIGAILAHFNGIGVELSDENGKLLRKKIDELIA